MNRKIFALFSVLMILLVGCGTSDVTDQLANVSMATNENVLGVKNGHPNSYPDITYGQAFESFFGSPTWKYFVGTKDGPDDDGDGKPDYTEDGIDIVEFTGYCTYADVEVKALLQFTLSKDDDTFSATYLSFNEVPQSTLIMYALIDKAFEEYENEHGFEIENNADSDLNLGNEEPSKEEQEDNNDTLTATVDTDELMDDIMVYYAMAYGTNSIDAEIDHEDDDSVTIRLFDPYATTTSDTLGFYSYGKKTGVWTDSVTGEIVDFGDASDAHNEKLEANNMMEETIPEYLGYVNAPDGYVNLRTGPGTSYDIICQINNGESFELYGEEAEASNGKKWIKISYYTDGRWNDGWVIASQVDY